jgi:Na+-driven multidrug efflux pump
LDGLLLFLMFLSALLLVQDVSGLSGFFTEFVCHPRMRRFLIAKQLIFFIAIYQVCHAMQVTAAFILRGYKVTFWPMDYFCRFAMGYWLARWVLDGI